MFMPSRPGQARPACLLVLLLAALPATAQNNSLLGARQRQEQRSESNSIGKGNDQGNGQGSDPGQDYNSQVLRSRATFAAERTIPSPNAVLLRFSPLAVRKPEPEKLRVNDLVTIIVRESKTVTTDGKMQTKKDWSVDSELTKWIRFSDVHGLVPAMQLEGKPAILFDWKNDYKGDGQYDRKDELITRVTARIIDVKPNGNLVLEARDEITVDSEGYIIALTGECRSRDITPQNTVLSTQITNRTIDVQHRGVVRDATKRGKIQRLIDFVNLF
jgi:flagellar L-ring protein precursor FlgH